MKIAAKAGPCAAIAAALCAPLLAQDVSAVTLPNTTITSGGYSYQATSSIIANSFVVDSGARATLQAGGAITLNPGFHAVNGSSFAAWVNPIFTPGNPVSFSMPTGIPQEPTFTLSVAPPTGATIAGGDIYLQAYGSDGSFHQCPINFTVTPSQVTMTDSGQQMSLPAGGAAVIASTTGECRISGAAVNLSSTAISTGAGGVSVILDLTFTVPCTYVITEDTYDANGNVSPLEYQGALTINAGSPTLLLTSPSLVVAPEGELTPAFQVNLVGVNGFTNSTQLALTNFRYSEAGVVFPTTVNPSGTDGYGDPTYSFAVQVEPLVNTGTQTVAWDIISASYPLQGSPTGISVNITENQAATITQTITSAPYTGLTVVVDNATCPTPCIKQWVPGSPHSITAESYSASGALYTFQGWSSGGQGTQTVSPTTPTVYTANFTVQYYLAVSANPSNEGSVSVSSNWFNAGQGVTITATPTGGYAFSGFTGCGLSGTNQTQTCVMTGPETVVANFAAIGQVTQTITSAPTGLLVTVDGTQYTTPQNFAWTPGSSHALSAVSQAGTTGTQYISPTWNVSGVASANITAPSTSEIYTASFTTQYYLTTIAAPSNEGTISPASGWYNSGTVVAITATPNSGYTFVGFTGALTGTNPSENLTMTGPESATANFPLQGQIEYPVPTSYSLSPIDNTGDSQTFTAVWTDSNGAADLSVVEIVFTPDQTLTYLASVVNACHIRYVLSSNMIELDDAAGDDQFPYSSQAGAGGQPLSNGTCVVDAVGSTSSSGTTEMLTVPVTFSPGGTQTTYQAWTSATTNETVTNGWINFGEWTAPVDPYATPDPSPTPYPDYLTLLSSLSAACNITGSWSDSPLTGPVSTGTWTLQQPDNTVNGHLTVAYNSNDQCGAETVTWNVSGTMSSGVASLNTSSPSPSTDGCGCPIGTISAIVNFSSCSLGQTTDTITIPTCTTQSMRRAPLAPRGQPQRLAPDQTASQAGTWTLSGAPVQFTVGPNPILLSTGDQNVTITTQSNISSVNLSNVVYVTSTQQNTAGNGCIASISIPSGSGTGSAQSTISAADPAGSTGCGAMTTAWANVAGTNTTNQTWIVAPPQLIMQMMYGEANSIQVHYGAGDITEEALGVTMRNRFGDSVYFNGSTTYQNTIIPSQFLGIINTSQTTWTDSQGNPTPALTHAANIFDGTSTVNVGNAKCFFSPNAADWIQIQAAIQSKTTTAFSVSAANDPKCFIEHKQFVYKSSIPTNTNGSGAPAFIFEQWRNLTDPAAIQIP